ncbi:MAG: rhomboid family intramembrane serine protease [Actinobacteria bacterium]|nr:rhomboid family intramembrane serine protease [Actinomycetota bacterium]
MYCYRHPDRETGLSCSDCGRPICTDCMTAAPVGLRCPEHATHRPKPAQVARTAARTVGRAGLSARNAYVTQALIAINVGVYILTVVQGAGLNSPGGNVFSKGLLFGPLVADGDWWRLITSAFLHANLLHLLFNMLALWWFGAPIELFLGRARFVLLYLVSGLAGSAGALLASPTAATVGASGAIFGILGAALVLERQRMYVLGGSALTIIVINIVFTFTVSGISVGGHFGGLVGGGLAMLALSHFGRTHPTYGRNGLPGIVGVIVVGAIAVLVSYWKVKGIV